MRPYKLSGEAATDEAVILTPVSSAQVALLPRSKPAGSEVEIKLLLSPAAFKAALQWDMLGADLPRPRAKRLRSVYFDTVEGDLQRQKAALRVRTVNRRHLLTFKWNGLFAGGAFERGEVEVLCPSEFPDIALLGTDIAEMIWTICNGNDLIAVYETDVRRIARLVQTGGSEVEVAFDQGAMIAADVAQQICEVELELKSGHPADLYQLGIALSEAFPVTLGCQSKAERGALLRSGKTPGIVRTPKLTASAPTVDEAISLALSSCVSHFIGNWPAFEGGNSVESVHQMRVAMRRMRSIIGLFHRAFPCAEFVEFRQKAKDIATAMGAARDWDVFLDLIRHGPAAAFQNEPGFEKIFADAQGHRHAGYEAVNRLLKAARTTSFVLSMQAFIARHGWRNGLSGETLPALTAPANDFATASLARLHRKILKRGQNFAQMPAMLRHDLRKDLKKLRYLLELFTELFAVRGQNKDYIRIVSSLQDELGILNDLAVAEEMIAKLNIGNDLAANRAAGIIVGWCGRSADANDGNLHKLWKKFRKSKFNP